MKFTYSKILYISIIIGIISSFLKQNFFKYEYPSIYEFNVLIYYFSYLLLIVTSFCLLMTNDKWNNNNVLKSIYFLLITIFFTWLYGLILGLNVGNNPVYVFRNYLFLSLSLPGYLIFSKMGLKGILEFSLKLPFFITPISLLLLPWAVVGLPSLIGILNNIFTYEFSRNLYKYTYLYASHMYFVCLAFSIAFKFEKNNFKKLLLKFNILNTKNKIISISFNFFEKYNLISTFWFLWLVILAYFGNAAILYLLFSILLYSFSKLKKYRYHFLVLLSIISIYVLPYIYKYFSLMFGINRTLQLPILFGKMSILGNGLGSEIANKGISYGTEILILGVIVQLGIFAIPFILLLIIYFKNLFIISWRGDSLGLLLSLGYGGYLTTVFSNPTISYPWTFFFTINGVILSQILSNKSIHKILNS